MFTDIRTQHTNMHSQLVFVFLLFVVHMYSGSVNALRCFHCNSYNHSRCADSPPPNEFRINCADLPIQNQSYTMCRKIIQYVDFNVYQLKSEKRVIRTCGWIEPNDRNKGKPCYESSGRGGYQYVCSCGKDYCNTATGIEAGSFLFTAGLPTGLLVALQKFAL